MSVAAVLMVRDEEDIIEPVIRHLLAQVDHVIVADNGSTDGTGKILAQLRSQAGERMSLVEDDEPGYWQSRKMTSLAIMAGEAGHDWVVPCDADEIWYRTGGMRLADYLARQAPDVQMVTADLYNHIPTARDDVEIENPVTRIGWRQRVAGVLPKVACRTHPSLVIHQGNHGASYEGVALSVSGLTIRHFSWRTREQYLRKIRNGEAAYAATDLPEGTGAHWRMFSEHTDETVMEHFDRWFYSQRPKADASLIYDPAPVR